MERPRQQRVRNSSVGGSDLKYWDDGEKDAKIQADASQRGSGEKLLSEKYSPGIDPTEEIERFIKSVSIIRIDIDTVTGKEAIELTRQRKSAST